MEYIATAAVHDSGDFDEIVKEFEELQQWLRAGMYVVTVQGEKYVVCDTGAGE